MLHVGEGARASGQEEGKPLSRFPAASPAHPLAGAGSSLLPPPWQQLDS